MGKSLFFLASLFLAASPETLAFQASPSKPVGSIMGRTGPLFATQTKVDVSERSHVTSSISTMEGSTRSDTLPLAPTKTTSAIHTPSLPNVTISVFVDLRAGWKDWGFSFFVADQLEEYGRYNYDAHWFHFTKHNERLHDLAKATPHCVLVSNPKGLEEIRQASAPHCKTWIINDEYCTYTGDLRFYFKEQKQQELFVPLGPRYDFHQSMQQAYGSMSNATATQLAPNERRYIFNAIFSKSTSPSRKELKYQLVNATDYYTQQHPNDYFIKIPGKWRRQMHPKFHVASKQYVEILRDSQFTLSPNGHNPECFRLWEAIIMGSIPVIVLDDEEYQTHKCSNSLLLFLEYPLPNMKVAWSNRHPNPKYHHLPLVPLSNWTELQDRLTEVQEQGTQALLARQKMLQAWYHDFMRSRIWAVEDFVVQSIANDMR